MQTLMHPTGINQIPLLSPQTTDHCAFPLPVYSTFYSLTAGQNIVQSPPTHSGQQVLHALLDIYVG